MADETEDTAVAVVDTDVAVTWEAIVAWEAQTVVVARDEESAATASTVKETTPQLVGGGGSL